MLAAINFNASTGDLVIVGNNLVDDTITLIGDEDTYDRFTVTVNNDSSLTQTFFNADVNSVKVYGRSGNDTIINTLLIDTEIFGQDGDDHLEGGYANDRVIGGNGIDILVGRNGDDVLNGQGGNDWLFGGPDNDTLSGVDGNDQLYGGTENDILAGHDGEDSLWGDEGDDTLFGGDGDDLLRGQDGNDTIRGGAGDDWLVGADGDDELHGDAGADELLGQNGNDTLHGGAGDDILYAGAGDDTLRGDTGGDHLYGHGGDDLLVAGSDQAADVLTGGKGLDEFVVAGSIGSGSVDAVTDRAGFETYNGYDGPLTALAEVEGDKVIVRGMPGDDTIEIFAREGQAKFELRSENQILGTYSTHSVSELIINTGDGNDLVENFNRSIIPMRVNTGAGQDVVSGGKGKDIISGGEGADSLVGFDGDDVIRGGEGNDYISGIEGNDELFGGTGHDRVFGGGGVDTLYGDEGVDELDGGTGDDLINSNDGEGDLLVGSRGLDTYYADDRDRFEIASDYPDDITDIVNIGVTPPLVGTASIGDLVFEDADGDGVFDTGELGIGDVAIKLFSGTTLVATQTTDSTGHYLFEELPEGDYRVELVTDLTGIYVLTTATSIDVELGDGEVLDTVDFGASLLPEEVIVQRSIQLITERLDLTVSRDVFEGFTSSLISASTEEVGNSFVVTAGVRKYVFQEISGDVFQFTGSFPSSLPSIAATELTANKTDGVFLHIIEKDRVGGTQGEFAVFSASEAGELRNIGDYLPGGNSINFAQPALDIGTAQDALQVVNEIYVGDYFLNPLAMYKTLTLDVVDEQVGPLDVARGAIDLAMTTNFGPQITAAALDGFDALSVAAKKALAGTANITIEKSFVELSPNWYKHDLYPRNWEYNSHSLLVELPSEAERDSVLDSLYLSIQNFDHLNVDDNNNSTVFIVPRSNAVAATDFTPALPRTRGGRFSLKFDAGIPGALDRFNLDVIIEDHDTVFDQNGQATGAKELQVVTIFQHPLVGSRKFRVEPVGDNQIKIITDAWEHSANALAQGGKDFGPPLVDQLWTTYIENLAGYAEELGAERVSQTLPGGVQTDQVFDFETELLGGVVADGILQRNDNPFRNDLRLPGLRVSAFLPGSGVSTEELRNAFLYRALFEADPIYLENFTP